MSTKTKIAAAGLAATLLLGGVGVTAASAQQDDRGARSERAEGHRHRLLRGIVRTAAEAIGIEPRDLAQRLRDGASIAQVASDEGIERQTVVDALVAAGEARVDAAVDAGRVTEERAATVRERLPERVERVVDRTR